ncbi:hypothetical protein [Pyrobaculum neutrophilum]|uniref:Uncharacterized protein n=1 Tax=Pyrobaculum neutrophilum (strain DSM 2338 / JCM 9278 / NBRC 100436 / V24Sta) TaxID=444157 RepID=B1YAT7_PYRNV|nr:hypothetical protein [Pyrobaculum neutrophilum]ACB39166.1 conserved hypothetical protein [Pyrobaculum neutrophilum V24Sta]
MEPRAFYDITEEEDRAELAKLIKAGVYSYAVLIPEDLPRRDVEEVFRAAGFSRVEVDASSWPRQIAVRTEGGTYVFKKVEEGVYRLSVHP